MKCINAISGFLLLLFVITCSENVKFRSTCGGDRICKEDEICVDGKCVKICRDNNDCPDNFVCRDGTCFPIVCNDSYVDGNESCDNGSDNGEHKSCTHQCQIAVCGDGFVFTQEEDCDDGNRVDLDTCSNTCKKAICGDGKIQAGETCDDGLFCTVHDTCINDQCMSDPLDCSHLLVDLQCQIAFCNEQSQTCLVQPNPDKLGQICNDTSACTNNDICQANGFCQGSEIDCSSLITDERCQDVSCDPANGCQLEAIHVNDSCDDYTDCTHNDVCQNDGFCRGQVENCDYLIEEAQCQVASCSDTGGCAVIPQNIGLPCDDFNIHTQDEICQVDGTCGGGKLLITQFIEITAGSDHSCGLTSDGQAFCWGKATNGRLGAPDTGSDIHIPVLVDMTTVSSHRFIQLSAGGAHTCGLLSDGNIVCWGSDNSGQLGNSSNLGDTAKPTQINTSQRFIAVSCGYEHTCGLTGKGVVYCWGLNTSGQLGLGSQESSKQSPTAINVNTISGEVRSILHISAGSTHTCAVVANGQGYCWGSDQSGQLGNGGFQEDSLSPSWVNTNQMSNSKTWLQIQAAHNHSCGMLSNGQIYCWGNNDFGQLGDNALVNPAYQPVSVDTSAMSDARTFVSMASIRFNTSCAIAADGVPYCWGADDFEQLGNGIGATSVLRPESVNTGALTGDPYFLTLSAGDLHACGITADLTSVCWGADPFGQLGSNPNVQNSALPAKVDVSNLWGRTNFITLDAGISHTCGRYGDGMLYCWGSDEYGQLGNGGNSKNEYQPSAVDIGSINNSKQIRRISLYDHSCAIAADGLTYCWGWDLDGQLGDGEPSLDKQSPALVNTRSMVDEQYFKKVAAGQSHTCGLTSEGVLYCWGSDWLGKLGIGSQFHFPIKQPTTSVEEVNLAEEIYFMDICCNASHTCALTANGHAYCWGHDGAGKLGLGYAADQVHEPTTVDMQTLMGEKVFKQIACGGDHTCALTAQGDIYCWGYDQYGELGNGLPFSELSRSPILVNTSNVTPNSTFKYLVSGLIHNCAITTDGMIYCWGMNRHDQLGNNQTEINAPSPIPIELSQVSGDQAFHLVVLGRWHSCAIAGDGITYCWGSDAYGQMSTINGTHSAMPIEVNTIGL